MTSALFVGVYGDATSRLIGAAALLLVFLSMAAVVNITVLSAFTAEWVREHVLDPNESAGMISRFLNFAVASRGAWKDGEGKEGFCSQFGAFFKDYVEPYQFYILVELVINLCLAAIDFQTTKSQVHCQVLNGSLLGLLIIQLVLLIWLNPVVKPLDYSDDGSSDRFHVSIVR